MPIDLSAFNLSGKRKPIRFAVMAFVTAFIIHFQACKPPGVKDIVTGEWYVCQELNLALRFHDRAEGVFIQLDKALASPSPFQLKKRRKTTHFQFDGHNNLKGRLSLRNDSLLLRKAYRQYAFVKYQPPVLPEAPFRYRDAVFTAIEQKEVVYGHAPGYYPSKKIEKRENKTYSQVLFDVATGISANLLRPDLPLEMDLYLPKNDTLQLRPLLVLLHAGAFIAGDKSDELVSTLADEFARKGFVTASVNYRLGYPFIPGRYANLERAMYKALQDVRAALRYLSHHRHTYQIDPHYVYLAGNSAGSILALKTALMDETNAWPSALEGTGLLRPGLGCLDCSGNSLEGPFTIKGVINMWGALDNIELINRQQPIPVLSIHGDKDPVVPYGHDYPFSHVSRRVSAYFSKKLHGSASIHQHAIALGLDHSLYTFEGLAHEPHFDEDHEMIPENYAIIAAESGQFLQRQLMPTISQPQGPVSLATGDPRPVYSFPPGFYTSYVFDCNDCLILKQTGHAAHIVWLDGAEKYQLYFTGTGPHGQIRTDSLQLRVARDLADR